MTKRTLTLTRLVGAVSLGGLVALAGCKSNEKAEGEGNAGEETHCGAEEGHCGADKGSCGGEKGSCGGEKGSCGGH